MKSLGMALGAPKILTVPDEVRRTLGQVRMDICAFVGIASKGPVRPVKLDAFQSNDLVQIANNWDRRKRTLPVKISSWEQFQAHFGGFNSPGRLPYAVANFFEQGGREAYICRIVHEYSDPILNQKGAAAGLIPNLLVSANPVDLSAKSEGSWGNKLQAAAGYTFTPIEFISAQSSSTKLMLADRQNLQVGDLLRVVNDDLAAPHDNYSEYRFVHQITKLGLTDSSALDWFIDLSSQSLPAEPTKLQLVKAQLSIRELGTARSERFDNLDLSPVKQRYIGLVLFNESELVDPQRGWILSELLPPTVDPFIRNFDYLSSDNQLAIKPSVFSGGVDRYADIVHEDFFDASWTFGDEQAGDGVHSLTHTPDCAMVCVPDLYVPESFDKVSTNKPVELLSGAEFAPCFELGVVEKQPVTVQPQLPGLMLDPGLSSDYEVIVSLQKRLVYLADQLMRFVILLDVPPQLTHAGILNWHTQFNSKYSAAYLPWLKVNQVNNEGEVGFDAKIINPSAVAAGIIAATELENGIMYGPANRIAKAVHALQSEISDSFHDRIHPLGVNVFSRQRDGIWLTAARTLSRETQWRQLSVVRLMTMLKHVLYQQMQWLVFETNNRTLWQLVKFKLENFLKQLFIAGAFRGETPKQAFFVRCDETLNTQQVIDSGKLIAHIGVAPAEPMEFIVLQLSREADGTLKIVSQ